MTQREHLTKPRFRSTSRCRRLGIGLALLAACALATGAWAQPLSVSKLPFQVAKEKSPPPKSAEEMEDPEWGNPFVSFLPPEAKTDWQYWQTRARLEAQERREAMQSAGVGVASFSFGETEPNDSAAAANFISGFGTAPGKDPAVDVTGSFSVPPPVPLAPLPEDEGSIPLATPTGLTTGTAVRVSAVVGDGPFGSAGTNSGDVDFYSISGVAAGQAILVDVDTPVPFGDLDPFVAIWDSAGNLLAFNDDDAVSFDSFLVFTAPAADTYFVAITGFGTFITGNPFDSSSGLGPGSEGTYDATIGLDYFESDFFSVKLRQGDVFGANLLGSANTVTLIDPGGTVRVGSRQDISFIYPFPASPLPGGGNAAAAYVIEEAGTWTVRIDGSSTGPYTGELRLARAGLESGGPGDVQKLFLDFDGATVDVAAIFGFGNPNAVLSPLSAFLANWGLTAADEDAVIDAIVANVVENLSEDMRVKGLNGDFDNSGIPGEFDVEILNSRDHPDTFGVDPSVSRLIVGGTIPELGIGTIGIAQSIDPGNYDVGETGFILLDLLSAPAGGGASLNSIPRAPGVSIIPLIAAAVGNITAHEAGHYLGSFHTEQFVGPSQIMDQGGNLNGTFGIGPDGIFGTADDEDVDFGTDVYVPNEGFFGIEDTLNLTAFGCPTPFSDTVVIDGCDSGAPNLFLADHTTINENLGDCVVASANEDDFEDCVGDLLDALEDAGILDDDDVDAIEECAEDASIPSLGEDDDDSD